MGLRFVLLGLLSKEPNSGYGIARELRRSLSHVWEARLQQIYAELGRALEHGLVDVRSIDLPNRPAKKVYSLTPAGEELLDGWLVTREDTFAAKDDLIVKLYCMERIPRDALLRQLSDRRERFSNDIEQLQPRLVQMPRTDPARLGELLTLEAALARAQAEVSWCERALAIICPETSVTASERAEAPRRREHEGESQAAGA